MIPMINRLRIPTLLGLSILILGITAGVYLAVREKSFSAKASPNLNPQNLTLSNISDSSVTISWQTTADTPAFITYGNEKVAKDDRDASVPQPRKIHHVTLKDLSPKVTYQYKIIEGQYSSDILRFTTPSPASSQNGFSPVIGSVLNGSKPLEEGVAYLAISGAVTQSAVIKNMGNFIIPVSTIRKSDMSDTFPLEEGMIAKIVIISDKGESSALFKLQTSSAPLPLLSLGQNLDFAAQSPEPEPVKYDLNNDNFINSADYAYILKNIGKQPANDPGIKKADLNRDGVIDKKDLDLISKELIRE